MTSRQRYLLMGAALVVALLALVVPAIARAPSRFFHAAGRCGDAPYALVQIQNEPRLRLEITSTPQEHAQGLMFREELPWDHGMLFDFHGPTQSGFWMRNTLIPLSIAWIAQDGTIVDIQDMQPLSDDVHTPSGVYWYALEVNQGWFAENGVEPGQVVWLCFPPGSDSPGFFTSTRLAGREGRTKRNWSRTKALRA